MAYTTILNMKQSNKSTDLTTVKSEAATADTVTASKPDVEGVPTPTVLLNNPSPSQKVVKGKKSAVVTTAEKVKAERIALVSKQEEEELKKPLSEEEVQDRERLIEVARKGLDSARLGDVALREIRDRKLWRGTHKTFAAFCQEEFDLSEQRVSQLLAFTEEVAQLQARQVKEELIPNTERAIRALRRVKWEHKLKVLQMASESSNGKRPNSQSIQQAHAQIDPPKPTDESATSVIAPKQALDAAKKLKEFIAQSDIQKMTIGDLQTLRAEITSIAKDAEEKLNRQ